MFVPTSPSVLKDHVKIVGCYTDHQGDKTQDLHSGTRCQTNISII